MWTDLNPRYSCFVFFRCVDLFSFSFEQDHCSVCVFLFSAPQSIQWSNFISPTVSVQSLCWLSTVRWAEKFIFKTNQMGFLTNVGFNLSNLMLSLARKPLLRERCSKATARCAAQWWICMIFAWGAPAAASCVFQTHHWLRPWQWLMSLKSCHAAAVKWVMGAQSSDRSSLAAMWQNSVSVSEGRSTHWGTVAQEVGRLVR